MYTLLSRSVCAVFLGLFLVASVRAEGGWTSSWLGKRTLINTYAPGPITAADCPAGKYVVGMEIRSGTLVDGMRPECASLGAGGEHQGLTQTTMLGNASGGNLRVVRCPSGQVVTAMRARAGEFIDQVSFACRSWQATQGLHGSLRWQPRQGGTGGEPVGPVECPSGKALVGMLGWISGSYIGQFRMTCADLPPTQSGGTMSAQSTLSPQGRPATSPVSRPAQIAQGVRPATALPQPIAPIVKALRSKPTRGGSAEITIDGEHFIASQGGRQTNQVTRVEIAGTSVRYRVVSPTRITATVPADVLKKLNRNRVPIVVTSGGKRISKQLPMR